jgi:hypothetical protein
MKKQDISSWHILIKASYETKQALEELKDKVLKRIILDLEEIPEVY